MPNQFSRTAMLIGGGNMEKLFTARVAVFGIGGVGGICAETLARAGVGRIDIFDDDRVCLTNINRQITALHSTIGKYKVDVMKERILDINPKCAVNAHKLFYTPDTADSVNLSVYGYIVDSVDTMTAKIELICRANTLGVPIISCMGAANKLDPTAFEVADIYETSVCPMARVMRRELKKRGIPSLKVIYSKEPPITPFDDDETLSCHAGCVCPPGTRKCTVRRQIPASNPFVPPTAGLILAGEVIKDLALE